MNPVIQYGFAGLCIILLVILVWLIKELFSILKDTNKIIAANTEAIKSVDNNSIAAGKAATEAKELLLQRPCVARFDIHKQRQ